MALADVNFTVSEGESHAIIGPNGAGKTTLFNIITGKYKPSSGNIVFDGKDVTRKPSHILVRMGISRSFQITNVFPSMTVFENVRAGVRSFRGLRYNFVRRPAKIADINERTEQILARVGLYDVMHKPVGALSYGRQRALEIAITLSTEPKLILLDEPTAGMTREESTEIVKLIQEVTVGCTLIIIEHDMDVVFSLADTISVLHYGTILLSNSPDRIRSDQRVKDAYLGDEM